MTGQVKEEIITRLGEFGLVPDDGRVSFNPVLLRRSEFLGAPEMFEYSDIDGELQTLELEKATLAFTYCQVPIVYYLVERNTITLHYSDGSTRELEGMALDREASREIFTRSGRIVRIDVHINWALEP
jgi:hypothetical protein